eukprot:m.306066 g.306066  ORF g.306066 m.306066 type:complete len:161 (+) comp40934_c0_seq1:46-528(+)
MRHCFRIGLVLIIEMYCILVFSLLLTLARGGPADGLFGYWSNELGSCMNIKTVSKDGQFSGQYYSKVGQAKFNYALIGRYDYAASSYGTLGWTVTWTNEHLRANSTTTWSAIYYPAALRQQEQIQSTWLLTTSKALSDVWETTLVGKDVFQKVTKCTIQS